MGCQYLFFGKPEITGLSTHLYLPISFAHRLVSGTNPFGFL
jgi:hypothetical protein